MTPKQIGAAVRKARGQRSISEVAEAAGLNRHQVRAIEQAATAYTVLSLLALCKAVGLRLAFQAKGSAAAFTKGSTGSDDVRMKYLSICSGIEAASVAFEPLGWRPLAFSEIEAFPRAVLQHHYPDTPCHGDFTELKDEPWIVDADMLCGGTPCQAFSIAGQRQSLLDDRGNLTLQFVLLADAIDKQRKQHGRDDAWILWENVPGVLSTHDNAFGAFLGGLAGNDGSVEPGPKPTTGKSSAFWRWSKDKHVPKWPSTGVVDGPTRCVAWRTLDAQHFGLAQRRKRVFVLARGGAGRWAAADALLPIIQSSRWHPAPSRGTGEGVAPTISARPTGGGGLGTDFDFDGGLTVFEPGQLKREGGDSRMSSHTAPTLRANMGDNLPAIAHTLTAGGRETGPHGALDGVNLIAHTLRGEGFDASEDGTGRGIPLVMATGQASAMSAPSVDMAPTPSCNHEAPIMIRMREGKEGGGKGPLVSEDQSLTLATGNDQVLAYAIQERAVSENVNAGPQGKGWQEGVAFTMEARHHAQSVSSGMQVRRLTPTECARLQGFPDDYLDITYRGKPAADGPKYKALGNSWAVPVVRWIGERIKSIGQ